MRRVNSGDCQDPPRWATPLHMRFLAFEGLDGSGKSTLIQGLKGLVEVQGIPVVVSREPGGTPMGVAVRELLLKVGADHPVPRAEALLYQADRAQHVETVIRPALAQKKWVISDRFAASSVAFQAGGREIQDQDILWLNHFSTGGLQPDLYILLDLSVEESLRRMAGRPQEADRFERENKDFHERVRQGYLEVAKKDPARWLIMNSAEKPEVLLQELVQNLKSRKWLA